MNWPFIFKTTIFETLLKKVLLWEKKLRPKRVPSSSISGQISFESFGGSNLDHFAALNLGERSSRWFRLYWWLATGGGAQGGVVR